MKGFLFDPNLCTGCHACILACANENDLSPERPWRQVVTFNPDRHPRLPLLHLSLACNHCQEPACLINCPANAYRQDEETGAVTVDSFRCLGCRYCTWACPYDAPRYNPTSGTVEKCDFCITRLRRGQDPACVTCCPTGALQVMERQESEEQEKIRGFTPSRIRPGIRFSPLRREKPECTEVQNEEAVDQLFPLSRGILPKKVSLRSEWALLLFTSLVAVLVALLAAGLTRGFRPNPFLFGGSGLAAMILSTLHLGHKERVLLAIANWRRSWLSLEIASLGLFLGISGLFLLFWPSQSGLGWSGVAVGCFALVVIDRVYQVAQKRSPLDLHSGQLIFSAVYLAGVLMLAPPVIILGGGIKLLLYLWRKVRFLGKRLPWRPWLSFLRVLFGFGFPALLLLSKDRAGILGFVIAAVIAGDLVDRAEFYEEMDVPTPSGQMRADLDRELQVSVEGKR